MFRENLALQIAKGHFSMKKAKLLVAIAIALSAIERM
jgi:hypothetical protein